MPDPQVLVAHEPKRGAGSRLPISPGDGWKWLGWFGLLLVAVGLGDFFLAWYPTAFGTPEWEFGTVVASFSGLPLVTMGFAGLLGSAVARGVRWQALAIAWVLVVFGVLLLLAYLMFLLDVPLALRAGGDQAAVQLGIKKAIAKTSLIALVFAGAYVGFGLRTLRHVRRKRQEAG
jgi:tellurite resistance protein TehA-like permease